VLRGLVISTREILHFGKSGLGFLDILSLQFFNLEGQLHMEGEVARVNRRRREKGRTCGRRRQAVQLTRVTDLYSRTCDSPYSCTCEGAKQPHMLLFFFI
jgi:hypothetical protein